MLSAETYHLAVLLVISIGLFGIMKSKNIIQVILLIEMMLAGVNLLLLQAAARNGEDPLGQVGVIMSTVIGAGLTAFLLALSIKMYRETGSQSLEKIQKLKW